MKFGKGSNTERTQNTRGSKYKMTYVHPNILLASERSERDALRGNTIEIGDTCLLAAREVSETVLGVDNAKSSICYNIGMYG